MRNLTEDWIEYLESTEGEKIEASTLEAITRRGGKVPSGLLGDLIVDS